MMEERPKLKVIASASDHLFDILGWLALIATWCLTIFNYKGLPEIIPTHFNGSGQIDGQGAKWLILTLPMVATILYIGMTVLSKFPQAFNYPTKITKENALNQYTSATRLIRYLKLIIVVIFGFITFQTIRVAQGEKESLGIWFLPVMIGLINIPLIYFVIKSFQAKK
jgi:uncharacterized membrane protein